MKQTQTQTQTVEKQKDLVIMAGGTVCKDVSAIGAHAGLMGRSCRPLAVFLAEIRHLRPQIVLHECTSRFMRHIFDDHLADLYDIYTIQPPKAGRPAGLGFLTFTQAMLSLYTIPLCEEHPQNCKTLTRPGEA